MGTNRYLGIWMDHSVANLIEFKETMSIHTIESAFTHHSKMEALHHSESGMHHKEKQLQEQYFKHIGEEILKYSKVLLFGPTEAKLELHNYLLKNNLFDAVQFEIQAADKLSENQQKAVVRDYFKNDLNHKI